MTETPGISLPAIRSGAFENVQDRILVARNRLANMLFSLRGQKINSMRTAMGNDNSRPGQQGQSGQASRTRATSAASSRASAPASRNSQADGRASRADSRARADSKAVN